MDPTNERARKHLNKLKSEHSQGDSTVTLDALDHPPAPKPARKKETKKPQKGRVARSARRRGARRSIVVTMIVVLVAGTAAAGWWGWTLLGTSLARNGAPVVSSPSQLSVTEGETVEFRLNAIDSDGDAIRVYSEKLPQGANLSATGDFAWTVGYDQSGAHSIEFLADDGSQISRALTTITVADKSVELAFKKPTRQSIVTGQTVRIELEAQSKFDNPVEYSLDGEPSGMKLKGDRITWTPSARQTGTHRIAVTGTDGIAEATHDVVIRVTQKPAKQAQEPTTGRLDWVLPKLANIYVDGSLRVREDTYLSIELPEGKHTVRAELLDGITAFEETVNVRGGSRTTLDPPKVAYGRLSVYFLGGVGELLLNGKKFRQQPPFTAVVVPTGRYMVSCKMFRGEDTREFQVVVKEGENTVVEYEIGNEPMVSYEDTDG